MGSVPGFAGIEHFKPKARRSTHGMHGDEQRWADEAVRTNWVSTVGVNTNEIERQMVEYLGWT